MAYSKSEQEMTETQELLDHKAKPKRYVQSYNHTYLYMQWSKCESNHHQGILVINKRPSLIVYNL